MDRSPFGSIAADLWDEAERRGRQLYRQASNAISAQDFTQRVSEEVAKTSTDWDVQHVDESSDQDPDEEGWDEVVATPAASSGPVVLVDQPSFKSTTAVQEVRYKISQKTIETVCEVLGISRNYAQWALKLFTLEASRNVGWVSNCQSVVDVVSAVKNRFPLLSDMQNAYREGRRLNHQSAAQTATGTSHPSTGPLSQSSSLTDAIHVPASIDDVPILTDETIRAYIARQNRELLVSSEGTEVFDRDVHGDMEVVFEGVNCVPDKAKLQRVQIIDADGIHDLVDDDD